MERHEMLQAAQFVVSVGMSCWGGSITDSFPAPWNVCYAAEEAGRCVDAGGDFDEGGL